MKNNLFNGRLYSIFGLVLGLLYASPATAGVCFLPDINNCIGANALASPDQTPEDCSRLTRQGYTAFAAEQSGVDCQQCQGTYYCKCDGNYKKDGGRCVERCPASEYPLTAAKPAHWQCEACSDALSDNYGQRYKNCTCPSPYTQIGSDKCVNCQGYDVSASEATTKKTNGYSCLACDNDAASGKYKCSCPSTHEEIYVNGVKKCLPKCAGNHMEHKSDGSCGCASGYPNLYNGNCYPVCSAPKSKFEKGECLCSEEYSHTKADNETCTGTPCDGKYRAGDCTVLETEEPTQSCSRFTYFWVENPDSDYKISVSGADKEFFPQSPNMPSYKVCENDTITLSVDNDLCRFDVSSWYFDGYRDGDGNYGTGNSVTFTVTDDFVNNYLNDVGWLTEEDESSATIQSVMPNVSYIGYKNSEQCSSATGKTCQVDNSTGCYIPATKAIIYCSYDDMLQTGNGCWEGTSWFDHHCTGALYTPCEVDYQVIANNGSKGTTICGGAQKAKNNKKFGLYTAGPTSLDADEYELYVSYVGAIGYTSGVTPTGISGLYTADGTFKYWVPDVMLVMNDMSMNSFKCYDIAYFGANKNSCSINGSVNIGKELSRSGLINWVDEVAYAGADSTSVNCPRYSNDSNAYSQSNRKYTFEAGKTYYIHVGASGSHSSDNNCTYAWGCGYRDD